MQLHLVDATYELFRAHSRPSPTGSRPGRYAADRRLRPAVTLLALLRDEGATHVGCAHDRVIRSVPQRSLAWLQERGRRAARAARPVPRRRGSDRGPRVRALADGRMRGRRCPGHGGDRWARPPGRVADPRLHARQGPGPGASAPTGWCFAIGVGTSPTTTRASGSSGACPPRAIPDCLALVGDAADGFPGIPGFGSKGAAALLTAFGTLEGIRDAPAGMWPGAVRGAEKLAATLRERWSEALLFRDLATLRTDLPLGPGGPERLRWDGADPVAWPAFCERWGLASLARRPPRWRPPA